MKKYASRTSRLTGEMIDEAKKLVDAFGLPVIDAPSEAEAQGIQENEDHDELVTKKDQIAQLAASISAGRNQQKQSAKQYAAGNKNQSRSGSAYADAAKELDLE